MASRLKVSDALNQFHFEGGASSSKPYFLQGSKAYDASPLRKRRQAISSSAKLKSAALQFWSTSGLSAERKMPKETYMFIHRRISKALAPELTEEEAAEAADEDWSEDSHGADEMTFDQCANSRRRRRRQRTAAHARAHACTRWHPL